MANDLKLQEGHPIDENLRPIKVGGEMTGIELSKDKVRANSLESKSIETNEITTNSISDKMYFSSNSGSLSDGHIEFENCGVGFDLVVHAYDATSTIVDFRRGNKAFVQFGAGNITSIQFVFPATSGNFTFLLKQDATGSRTVTNYKAYNFAFSGAAGGNVKFAGGSNPTLTTDSVHVDIISIFWDADNEVAYAVPSLDFQF